MTRVSLISSSGELRQRLRPLTGDTSFSPARGRRDGASRVSHRRS